MNILYISQMSNIKWAGPAYSIPRQIKAQSAYDNVFWYHMKSDISPEWEEQYKVNSTQQYPRKKISDLPEPFNKPDLVIVEQFYGYAKLPIRKELVKGNIPYIIVPRGELTNKAQRRKSIKKKIGNSLIFNRFARKALAIQYLTEDEMKESGGKWNENSIVIPNGTDKKEYKKDLFNNDKLIVTNIGRIEKYQKGIDLLIYACKEIKEELLLAKCEIHIYGPDAENQRIDIEKVINDEGLQSIIYIHGPVFGEEKKKVLLESDIFIMTSRFEGHPMALIEAMSYGIPCFATDGTNMSKEIDAYNSGWTARNNVESIKVSILNMIKEKNLLNEKGNNSLRLSRQYDWNEIAKQSHIIYKNILSVDK